MKTFTINVDMLDSKVKFHVDLGEDYESENLVAGESGCTLKDDPPEIFIRDSKDIKTVCHEIFHCVKTILDNRHIEDEETGAYLFDYIIGKYCDKVGLILTSK